MKKSIELQQVIYNVLKMQIQFGAYQFEERLPTIEDAARLFLVSVKTIRAAYQHLQRDGYITISKSIGVKVSVQYSKEDTERYIQQFFSGRKNALLDLGQSMRLLFSNAQWLGFKNASPEILSKIEKLTAPKESMAPYIMIQQLQSVYGVLGNDLLMRLVWQAFMFFLTPFLSVPGNLIKLNKGENPLLQMIDLCRKQNWPALRASVDAFQDQKWIGFSQFYEDRILLPVPEQQIAFTWSGYRKSSQICYSLGMELLVAISWGVYPSGSLLPSLSTLAKEKHISVNTVRYTMAHLNNIGAAKSINGLGTRVLPPEQIAENCDLSNATIQKRLLDHAKSVHILALSCRQASEATISSMDQAAVDEWKATLEATVQMQRYELVPYTIVNLISRNAPFMAVRTVYAELFQQLFWGYPLQSLLKNPPAYSAFYAPYYVFFMDCLERFEAAHFSAKLEELMRHEINFIVDQLTDLGIGEAAALVLDW